jgi:hypothetical protein
MLLLKHTSIAEIINPADASNPNPALCNTNNKNKIKKEETEKKGVVVIEGGSFGQLKRRSDQRSLLSTNNPSSPTEPLPKRPSLDDWTGILKPLNTLVTSQSFFR